MPVEKPLGKMILRRAREKISETAPPHTFAREVTNVMIEHLRNLEPEKRSTHQHTIFAELLKEHERLEKEIRKLNERFEGYVQKREEIIQKANALEGDEEEYRRLKQEIEEITGNMKTVATLIKGHELSRRVLRRIIDAHRSFLDAPENIEQLIERVGDVGHITDGDKDAVTLKMRRILERIGAQ